MFYVHNRARVLDSFENHLAVPVDIIQDPIPSNALFDIEMVIPPLFFTKTERQEML